MPDCGAMLDMPTRGKVCVDAAGPPPKLEVGFLGFVTVIVRLPALARANSAVGTLITSDVPAALAVPVSGVFNGAVEPSVTIVELLNPVPVIVICCADVAPAIKPRFGKKEACVGTALSMLVMSLGDDLSVDLPSLGSETVTMFVTVKPAAVDEVIALGATETVSVNVVLPAGTRAAPVYVQVTICAF